MFTGIVSDVGEVLQVEDAPVQDRRIVIGSSYGEETFQPGISISCSGCCLTVTGFGAKAGGTWFAVDVSQETLDKTTLGSWEQGRRVNLERALTLADELGGHLVQGHVDGTAEIVDIAAEAGSRRFTFDAPEELAPYIAPKGSVCLDGTSLTVNEVDGARFTVNLIPHTLEVTTWNERAPGDAVNLEADLLARYVARLMQAKTA